MSTCILFGFGFWFIYIWIMYKGDDVGNRDCGMSERFGSLGGREEFLGEVSEGVQSELCSVIGDYIRAVALRSFVL
ncbi:MAG: hypothetical protein C4B59_16785 [Candidatus Methanogaster sp.]|uniref:Uncharacterized protein n=1 Tax=Candidatus Methanogaster sp. TaxID=3386292 RepID=A0AC61KXX7_9EURY|nr:MAG: hypothetical protein C4B59_16785 [ANME-2 cluster archaeon]